ncbi:MAG: hypothetical protein KF886_26395 [Candidatus Hydrogenedentes bacterium]|nr:hypothetical protein [Candidatus Hydrogenedentota bacterium]
MKRALLLMLAVLAAGCGESAPDAPATPDAAEQAAPGDAAPPEDVMENVSMDLWPSTDTPGEDVKPLLSIRAERVTGMRGDMNTLSFEGAEAVAPASAPGAAPYKFKAASGAFVEGERAVLSGGVTAEVDDMIIELEEITWAILPGAEGGGGHAWSDRPLRITSPTQKLEAASLRLNVLAQTIELREVTGEITFEGTTP